MNDSRTQDRNDKLVMWSALVLSAAMWSFGIGFTLGGDWQTIIGVGAVYAGVQAFLISRFRYHPLEAEVVASPVFLGLFTATVLVLRESGHPVLPPKHLELSWPSLWPWLMFSVVFGGSFIAALAYSASLDSILRRMHRNRIAIEKCERAREPSTSQPPPA